MLLHLVKKNLSPPPPPPPPPRPFCYYIFTFSVYLILPFRKILLFGDGGWLGAIILHLLIKLFAPSFASTEIEGSLFESDSLKEPGSKKR